ncbi:PspC domain-containing protein [Leucobacter soli]|uniref:PspC domain-containing protein n=1 Tax=Leucobacter soli TaxID=2812850 RepID=UPI00360616F6
MTTTTPLVRSREDRLLGGVCAGLAMHLGLPVVWVRGECSCSPSSAEPVRSSTCGCG